MHHYKARKNVHSANWSDVSGGVGANAGRRSCVLAWCIFLSSPRSNQLVSSKYFSHIVLRGRLFTETSLDSQSVSAMAHLPHRRMQSSPDYGSHVAQTGGVHTQITFSPQTNRSRVGWKAYRAGFKSSAIHQPNAGKICKVAGRCA